MSASRISEQIIKSVLPSTTDRSWDLKLSFKSHVQEMQIRQVSILLMQIKNAIVVFLCGYGSNKSPKHD